MIAVPDLGPCWSDWCDQPAVAYVAGPTTGHSPRVTVIAGQRAAQLVAGAALSLRCIDCAVAAVEETVGHQARTDNATKAPFGGRP